VLDDRLAVPVAPIQDGEVAPALGAVGAVAARKVPGQGFEGGAEALDDDVGFVRLVSGVDELDRFARDLDRPERLAGLKAKLVVCDQGVRCREDVRARSAILQEWEAADLPRPRSGAQAGGSAKRSSNWRNAA